MLLACRYVTDDNTADGGGLANGYLTDQQPGMISTPLLVNVLLSSSYTILISVLLSASYSNVVLRKCCSFVVIVLSQVTPFSSVYSCPQVTPFSSQYSIDNHFILVNVLLSTIAPFPYMYSSRPVTPFSINDFILVI